MTLVKRSDWSLNSSTPADLIDNDRFFCSPWLSAVNAPAVSIKENEKTYEVELAAPGYHKEDLNISIDHGVLTISAEHRDEKENKEDSYTCRDFVFSSFSRSFNLPINANEENIDAEYTDGELKVIIEKIKEPTIKPRKQISIK